MSFADYKVIDFFLNYKIFFQKFQKYLYFSTLLPLLPRLRTPLFRATIHIAHICDKYASRKLHAE